MNQVCRMHLASLTWKHCGRRIACLSEFRVNPMLLPSPSGSAWRRALFRMQVTGLERRLRVSKLPSRSWSKRDMLWSVSGKRRRHFGEKQRKTRERHLSCGPSFQYGWRKQKSKLAEMRRGFWTRRERLRTASLPSWMRCAATPTMNSRQMRSTGQDLNCAGG